MSTGLDCQFYRLPDGRWYYALEDEHSDGYNYVGPFDSLDQAESYLSSNEPNPGGYSVTEIEEDDNELYWVFKKCTEDAEKPILGGKFYA